MQNNKKPMNTKKIGISTKKTNRNQKFNVPYLGKKAFWYMVFGIFLPRITCRITSIKTYIRELLYCLNIFQKMQDNEKMLDTNRLGNNIKIRFSNWNYPLKKQNKNLKPS